MAKAPPEVIVEGRNITELQWTAVQKFIVEMTEALLLERGERTKSRKECDVIRTFWQNTEKDYEQARVQVLKKNLDVSVVWDKHAEPYGRKEQEITFQKFILNFDAEYQSRENERRAEQIANKWNNEVLPKMMETKHNEVEKFGKKEEELYTEYKDAQKEYEKIIEEAVKKADDKMLDWEVTMVQRTVARKKYEDLQFLLKKLCCSEQKNLLIHDLKAEHKVNFEKIRCFIRERVEGDLLQIISLSQHIEKQAEEYQSTSKNIERYKHMVKAKQAELNELNKSVKLCELRVNSYKQNIDVANRCYKKIERLNKEKAGYDERKKELEAEIKKRQENKLLYLDLLQSLKEDVNNLQQQYLGDIYGNLLDKHLANLKNFDELFGDYEKKSPESARAAKEQFFLEKSELDKIPLLITREIKGHNDFIEAAMAKLQELGVKHVPDLVRVGSRSFPTSSGPAGLVTI